MLAVIILGIVITPINGMIITKKGTIFYVPDFRIKKVHVEDLERLSLVFNEWGNCQYSVAVRIVNKDGSIFDKNYSKQFSNMKNKKLAMSIYTIEKRKVDKICEELLDFENCIITIVDKTHKITYQNK